MTEAERADQLRRAERDALLFGTGVWVQDGSDVRHIPLGDLHGDEVKQIAAALPFTLPI